MSQLKTNLEQILQEKQEKIIPENIKKDVQIFDVVGTLESNVNTSSVKLFETVEEMQADTTAQEGDLAIVYKKEKGNMTVNTHTQYITFPETVTLPEVITQEYNNCMLHSPEGDGRMLLISLSPTQFQAAGYTMAGMIIAMYTSEDGINYTRTALGGTSGSGIDPNIIDLPNPMDFGTLMYCDTPDLWNDNFGYFMQINGDFKGLYEYKIDIGYELISAQLSLSNSNELLLGRIAYGKNGITFGTLKTLDTSDANATADDIVTSKTAYVNGQKITGSLPLFPNTRTFTVDNAGVTNNADDSQLTFSTINTLKQTLDSNLNMKFSANYIDIAPAIGLTPDKIKAGETILGIEGTATIGDDVSNYINMKPEGVGRISFALDLIKEIPLIDTGNMTGMAGMFQNMRTITTIPQLNTSNVTSMDNMFNGCSNLQSIPQLNTSNVTSMGHMFLNCNNLTSVPLLNTSSVTNMSSMFNSCTSLTTIPLLDTSIVTDMSSMFRGCTLLTTIPLLDTSSVTSMSSMFLGCPSLSNDSLNNLLQMCINAVTFKSTKSLRYIGLSEEQATKCTTLSNYTAFTEAGWTTGY